MMQVSFHLIQCDYVLAYFIFTAYLLQEVVNLVCNLFLYRGKYMRIQNLGQEKQRSALDVLYSNLA